MRRLLIGLGTVLLSLVWVVAGPLPAQARESNCFAGEVCLYDDARYYGCFYRWTGNDTDYRNNRPSNTASSPNCSRSMNDIATSIDNDGRNCGSTHFENLSYQGNGFYLTRGAYVESLSSSYYNNRLTSHRWC